MSVNRERRVERHVLEEMKNRVGTHTGVGASARGKRTCKRFQWTGCTMLGHLTMFNVRRATRVRTRADAFGARCRMVPHVHVTERVSTRLARTQSVGTLVVAMCQPLAKHQRFGTPVVNRLLFVFVGGLTLLFPLLFLRRSAIGAPKPHTGGISRQIDAEASKGRNETLATVVHRTLAHCVRCACITEWVFARYGEMDLGGERVTAAAPVRGGPVLKLAVTRPPRRRANDRVRHDRRLENRRGRSGGGRRRGGGTCRYRHLGQYLFFVFFFIA